MFTRKWKFTKMTFSPNLTLEGLLLNGTMTGAPHSRDGVGRPRCWEEGL